MTQYRRHVRNWSIFLHVSNLFSLKGKSNITFYLALLLFQLICFSYDLKTFYTCLSFNHIFVVLHDKNIFELNQFTIFAYFTINANRILIRIVYECYIEVIHKKTYISATQKTCYGTFRTLIFNNNTYFSKFCSSNFYFRFNARENYQISEIEQKQECLNKILLAVANTKKVE